MAPLGWGFGLACSCAMPASAQESAARPAGSGEPPIVVTGTRSAPSDRELTKRVESALDAARYLDASRITVTTKDGVVTLEGIVGDISDLRTAIRVSSRVAGARRIDDNLEMPAYDEGP